jgi:hypothetical protein
MHDPEKSDSGIVPQPRRSRANLRPPSRSASVIDRLLKNQNPLDNRNNLRSSSPHPGRGQTSGEPRRNFAVRNSSTREPWLFRSPVFGSGIRRLDGEAVGGRRLARTPPRRVTRWLAASTIAPPAPALSSAGDDFRPHHAFLDRKIVARLFKSVCRQGIGRLPCPPSSISRHRGWPGRFVPTLCWSRMDSNIQILG